MKLAVIEERQRMGNLHDNIGQVLGLSAFRLRAYVRNL